MLVIDQISKTFKDLVLQDFSLQVVENEIVTLLGPSGCGKSTLLNIVGNVIKPDAGTIMIDSEFEIAYSFQNDNLLPWRDTLANLMLPTEINQNFESGQIADLLDSVDLGEYKNYFPSELSGGMKQKLSYARAISTNPNILLLDEPFSNVDYFNKTKLEEQLYEFIKDDKTKRCCVLVTHSLDEAVALSDRIILMTSSPGSVANSMQLNRKGESPGEYRKTSAFEETLAALVKLINEH